MIFDFSPWTGTPYKDAADENAITGLSLDAFLSKVLKSFTLVSIPSLLNFTEQCLGESDGLLEGFIIPLI